MNQLNAKQLTQRKEIFKVMVTNCKEKRPWLTLKQAVESVAYELQNDPMKLRIINALAASTGGTT